MSGTTALLADAPMGGSEPHPGLLVVEGLTKSFGGVHAVRACSFDIAAHTVTGLIGPNGAGKSTAVDLISGMLRADAGRILFGGEDVTRLPLHRKARAGIVRTFQRSREFPGLTVVENMLVAPAQPAVSTGAGGASRRQGARLRKQELTDLAWSLLDRFNLSRHGNTLAGSLSGGQKRLLEVARALMRRPTLLILDEPMSGVNPALGDQLARQIQLVAEEGVTVLLIEHNLNFVERLCPRVIVLAQGAVLAGGSMDELRTDPEVLGAYLGAGR